jgi:hypothetical protein
VYGSCLSVFERVNPDDALAVSDVCFCWSFDFAGFERSPEGYRWIGSSVPPIIDDATVFFNLH